MSDSDSTAGPQTRWGLARGKLTMVGFEQTSNDLSRAARKNVLPEVQYSFSLTDVNDTQWSVLRFQLSEAVSTLYQCTLDLVSPIDNPEELLGATATFQIKRSPLYRRIHGVITDVDELGVTDGDQVLCRVTLRPALYVLTQRTNCRVFQNLTVIEIVQQVLSEGLAPYKRTMEWAITNPTQHPKRECCVQFNESDYAFVARLLHEEGIAFVFRESESAETITLFDGVGSYTKAVTMDFRGRVPMAPTNAETHEIETVQVFHRRRSLQSTSVVTRDYDFTNPDLSLHAEAKGKDARQRDRERFRWEHDWTLGSYDSRGDARYAVHDGSRRAKSLREALQAQEEIAFGESVATCLEIGRVVTFGDSRQQQPEEKRVVIGLEHRGYAAEVARDAGVTEQDGATPRYANRFRTSTPGLLFRSLESPAKPVIPGMETAIVVGPESEEIHTDEHGRVRVQFHWDRYGARTETSFAWLRVMQSWSGAGFGTQFIPRVGMEVAVSFLDGNPDRPVISGCLYNGTHPYPYKPNERPTVSAIRTQSSPGGEIHRFNEILFDDASGQERLLLRAQQDMHTTVLRDQSNNVGNDQRETVGGHSERTVTGNHRESIHGARTLLVEHDDHWTVNGSFSGQLRGDATVAVGQTSRCSIGSDLQLQVAKGLTTIVGSKRVPGQSVDVTLGEKRSSAERVVIRARDEIVLQVGESQIVIDPKGVRIESDNVQLLSREKLMLSGNTSVTLLSEQVQVRSKEARIQGGSGQVHIKDTAEVRAPSIHFKTGSSTDSKEEESDSELSHTLRGSSRTRSSRVCLERITSWSVRMARPAREPLVQRGC